MWRTSISNASFRLAGIGVAQPPNLCFAVDTESLQKAVAFHLRCTHYTAHFAETLSYRQNYRDGVRSVSMCIFPIGLNMPPPRAIQIWERNEPALKVLAAPQPGSENCVGDHVGGCDERYEFDNIYEVP